METFVMWNDKDLVYDFFVDDFFSEYGYSSSKHCVQAGFRDFNGKSFIVSTKDCGQYVSIRFVDNKLSDIERKAFMTELVKDLDEANPEYKFGFQKQNGYDDEFCLYAEYA
ncbi:MAG: hypothetical protein K5854_01675 [Prevotella sp.]|nr:hypothetical protein [Prevotella sp.]